MRIRCDDLLCGNLFPRFGGLPGDSATASVSVGTDVSGSIAPTKRCGKVSPIGSVGITGKRKNAEQFSKLQVTGTIEIGRTEGKADTNIRSVFLEITTGVKF